MGRCVEGMAWFWPVPLGKCSASFPEVRSLDGGLDVCSCGSCQGKSVSRSQALGVGHCGQVGKKAKEKKKSKVQLWPGLGPSLCNPASPVSPSHGKAWVRSGPTCTLLHSEFTYQLTRYFPKFQNPKTTRAGSCLICALRLCSFLLVTATVARSRALPLP